MATITVKNIPEDLYEQLKQSAEAHRRSINSEIIICIEQTVRSSTINPKISLERARNLRGKTISHPISDLEFNQAKADGRL